MLSLFQTCETQICFRTCKQPPEFHENSRRFSLVKMANTAGFFENSCKFRGFFIAYYGLLSGDGSNRRKLRASKATYTQSRGQFCFKWANQIPVKCSQHVIDVLSIHSTRYVVRRGVRLIDISLETIEYVNSLVSSALKNWLFSRSYVGKSGSISGTRKFGSRIFIYIQTAVLNKRAWSDGVNKISSGRQTYFSNKLNNVSFIKEYLLKYWIFTFSAFINFYDFSINQLLLSDHWWSLNFSLIAHP